MFDVSWTDPDRETVGQRKSRKDQQANGVSRVNSVRSEKSNEASTSQTRPSLLKLFGSGSSGSKKTLRRTGSNPKLASLRNDETTSTKASRRFSSYTVTSDSSGQEFPSTSRIHSQNYFNGDLYHSDAEQSTNSELSESIFSGWTGHSNTTDSTWNSIVESPMSQSKFVQSLSASSFVMQSTEVTVSPRESVKADEQIATVVSISAAGSMPVEIYDSHRKVSPEASKFDFPLPNYSRPESITLPPSPSPAPKPKRHEICPVPPVGRYCKSDSWRPPDAWECAREDAESSVPSTKLLGPPLIALKDIRRKPIVSPAEMTHLQRSIKRMESASPKIILERLKEEWLEVADASVYRELELEKQLWMLTALRGLKKRESEDMNGITNSSLKLLSLYENHAASSFLSALNPRPKIHHISTFPLSPTSYPNIQPLIVPSPTSQLPYASKIFDSIHAFSLPTILPASSIPSLLKDCHRVLTSAPGQAQQPGHLASSSPGSPVSFSSASTRTIIHIPSNAYISAPAASGAGSIHLTVLDPAPLPDTLGPRLRRWLDDHLTVNLERQFRCINPGRLFPIWLADAGLRGNGSTIVNVRFLACIDAGMADGIHPGKLSENGTCGGDGKERTVDVAVKTELKSVVGRMLWKEMWGSFVEGERWWWEDSEIVQECIERGTCWEYAVIEGIKEDLVPV